MKGGIRALVSSMATMVAHSARKEPTERSISPWAITTSMPNATIAVTEVWRIRLMMLRSLRKMPSVNAKKISQTINTANTSPAADRDCANQLLRQSGPGAVDLAAANLAIGVVETWPACKFFTVTRLLPAKTNKSCSLSSCAASVATCRPSRSTTIRSDTFKISLFFERAKDNCRSPTRGSANQFVDIMLCSDIDTAGGFVEQEGASVR